MDEQRKLRVDTSGMTNHIGIILDRSGSMDRIRQEVIDGFNQQIQEICQQSKEIKTKVSLLTFSDTVSDPVYWEADPDNLVKLTLDKYRPSGQTALNDAIGTTIKRMKQIPDDQNSAFLLIVITDGQENNSSEFTHEAVNALMEEVKKTGKWTITFIGQDAKQAESYHVTKGNFRQTAMMNRGEYVISQADLSRGISHYYASRASGQMAVSNFFSQAEEPQKDVDSGASPTDNKTVAQTPK